MSSERWNRGAKELTGAETHTVNYTSPDETNFFVFSDRPETGDHG
jgi:hypothetical protein